MWWKMFAQKTYQFVKITRLPNDANKASDSVFTVTFTVSTWASAQTFSCFGNSTIACASIFCSQLRSELTWCQFSSPCSNSVVFVITRKISRNFFLEIYVTHDVISSNLALIVLTLYKFSVQKFLNVWKVSGSHCTNCVTSQLLKENFIWLVNVQIKCWVNKYNLVLKIEAISKKSAKILGLLFCRTLYLMWFIISEAFCLSWYNSADKRYFYAKKLMSYRLYHIQFAQKWLSLCDLYLVITASAWCNLVRCVSALF